MALREKELKGHVVVYAVIKFLPNCNHLIAALEIVTNTVANWGQAHLVTNILRFATNISPLFRQSGIFQFSLFSGPEEATTSAPNSI